MMNLFSDAECACVRATGRAIAGHRACARARGSFDRVRACVARPLLMNSGTRKKDGGRREHVAESRDPSDSR